MEITDIMLLNNVAKAIREELSILKLDYPLVIKGNELFIINQAGQEFKLSVQNVGSSFIISSQIANMVLRGKIGSNLCEVTLGYSDEKEGLFKQVQTKSFQAVGDKRICTLIVGKPTDDKVCMCTFTDKGYETSIEVGVYKEKNRIESRELTSHISNSSISYRTQVENEQMHVHDFGLMQLASTSRVEPGIEVRSRKVNTATSQSRDPFYKSFPESTFDDALTAIFEYPDVNQLTSCVSDIIKKEFDRVGRVFPRISPCLSGKPTEVLSEAVKTAISGATVEGLTPLKDLSLTKQMQV